MERFTFKKWGDERFQDDIYLMELDEETARILNPGAKHQVVAGKAIDKFAEYEIAEEDRRLLILPCKVGDTVWFIKTYFSYYIEPKAETVKNTVIWHKEICFHTENRTFRPEDIDKTVFLTREAAEQVLKEMED